MPHWHAPRWPAATARCNGRWPVLVDAPLLAGALANALRCPELVTLGYSHTAGWDVMRGEHAGVWPNTHRCARDWLEPPRASSATSRFEGASPRRAGAARERARARCASNLGARHTRSPRHHAGPSRGQTHWARHTHKSAPCPRLPGPCSGQGARERGAGRLVWEQQCKVKSITTNRKSDWAHLRPSQLRPAAMRQGANSGACPAKATRPNAGARWRPRVGVLSRGQVGTAVDPPRKGTGNIYPWRPCPSP